jgi:hypothetical protein
LKVGAANDAKKADSVESIKRGIAILEDFLAANPNNERAYREVGLSRDKGLTGKGWQLSKLILPLVTLHQHRW